MLTMDKLYKVHVKVLWLKIVTMNKTTTKIVLIYSKVFSNLHDNTNQVLYKNNICDVDVSHLK